MARRTVLILVVLALGVVALLPTGAGAAPARYIVVLHDWVTDPGAVASEHASAHAAGISHVYGSALKGYAAVIPAERVAAVRADDRVAYVTADTPVSINAKPVAHPPQTIPTGIDRIDADLSATAAINGSDGPDGSTQRVNVDVAVIDTGIDTTHADLNVDGGTNCATGKSYKDGNGHGTHVAGTIGALDNSFGVVGVAPGARLWAVRVLDNSGSGWRSWVICGIDWVTKNAGTIEVANMSLGGPGADDGNCGVPSKDVEHAAICASVGAGVTYAVAAGNSREDASRHVPAAYDEVITVSALADFDGRAGGLAGPTCRSDVGVDDSFATFSNFGPDVDLIAPGVCINSTWKGGGYNTISGTSMASPHVAGAAALYLARNPRTSPAAVQAALMSAGTADDWSGDPDGTVEPLLKVAAL